MDIAERDRLIDQLAQMPLQLRTLAQALPPQRAHWRAQADGFSLVEHACHLRDLEHEGYQLRIRRLLDENVPALQEIDGSAWALERDYQAQPLGEALAAFDAQRSATMRLLVAALPQHAARKGLFGGFGIVTLAGLAREIAAHDAAHRVEIAALVEAARAG